jgi:hypothetical protein
VHKETQRGLRVPVLIAYIAVGALNPLGIVVKLQQPTKTLYLEVQLSRVGHVVASL